MPHRTEAWPPAGSLVFASVNAGLGILALRVAAMLQETVMAWLWAVSVFYAITLGPMVFLALTLVWALRDFARGERIQAVIASCIGLATTVLLFGRIGMDF